MHTDPAQATATATTTADSADIPFIDVLDPAFRFDTAEVAQAQERHWYARTPLGLLVLRYAEAQELVRDSRLTHNGKGFMEQNGVSDGSIYEWFVPAIVNHDGESHRRLRSLVNRAFTPRMIEGLRPLIRRSAQSLAEELAAAGRCEFIADFADRLPLAVMTELLGVPAEDFGIFRAWSSDIGLVFSLALGGDIPGRVEAAVDGLYGYVDGLMAAKADNPGDDLISALVTAQGAADGESRVSRDELRNLVVTMVFAAHDTTRLQLANAMVTFSEHPDQWRLLGERPELANQTVEEVMRWLPSSNAVYRFAGEDLEFRGERVQAGTLLMIGVQAAQRDPRAYPGGEVFNITAAHKSPVLQFGGGPHYCLGAPLARLELAEALPVLAGRLAAPVIAGPFSWRPAIGIYGPNELPLRFG
jgi:cytochrome P450